MNKIVSTIAAAIAAPILIWVALNQFAEKHPLLITLITVLKNDAYLRNWAIGGVALVAAIFAFITVPSYEYNHSYKKVSNEVLDKELLDCLKGGWVNFVTIGRDIDRILAKKYDRTCTVRHLTSRLRALKRQGKIEEVLDDYGWMFKKK